MLYTKILAAHDAPYLNDLNTTTMKHREHIKALVEKFLDGRTTLAEEQALYDYFASDNIPQEWHDLKAMFAWYSEGMPEERLPHTSKQRKQSHTKWWVAIGGVAAAAIALIITFTPQRQRVNIYEGSYTIVQGVYCDNIEEIESDIEMLLMRADDLERRADSLLALAE